MESNHSKIDGLRRLVQVLSGFGHCIYFYQCVYAIEAEPSHELLRREALEIVSVDVGHGEVGDAGERLHVGRRRARILVVVLDGAHRGDRGLDAPALARAVWNLVDDLLRQSVVDRVNGAIEPQIAVVE